MSSPSLFTLLLAVPCLVGFDFTAFNGTKWHFEVPPGLRIISAQDGIDEGAQLQLASSPAATWQNPWPPEGEAFIVVGFYMQKGTTAADVLSKKNARELQSLPAPAMVGKKHATKVATETFGMAKKGAFIVVVVEDYPITISVYDNGREDTDAALAALVDSLQVMP